MESTWTITELAAAATAVLSGEPVQVNGRTRDMPNERLIRWYTTIGLVDPPVARRGRVALYGRRHLLQLVAVKRRQAAGRTIAQIQAELTGATDDSLRRIAQLPGDAAPSLPAPMPHPSAPDAGPATSAPPSPGTRRFWTAPPTSPPPSSTRDLAVVRDAGEETPSLVHGVRLAPGVTLLLDGDAPGAEDLAAIGAAARPLLDALHHRGLPRAPTHTADTGRTASGEPSAQFPTGRSS